MPRIGLLGCGVHSLVLYKLLTKFPRTRSTLRVAYINLGMITRTLSQRILFQDSVSHEQLWLEYAVGCMAPFCFRGVVEVLNSDRWIYALHSISISTVSFHQYQNPAFRWERVES